MGALASRSETLRLVDWPLDPDRRVVPGDAGLGRRVVVGGDLVVDVGDFAEHAEPVREPTRDEELVVALVVELVALPLAVGR